MSPDAQISFGTPASHEQNEMHTSAPSDKFDDSQDEHITGPETDDEAIQRLKDLFENNAGVLVAGCRDTIDSIISNYERLRDEVKEDPRISLALSMGIYQSANHAQDGIADTMANEEVIAPSEGHRGQSKDGKQRIEEDTIHRSIDGDAEHLQHAAVSAIDRTLTSPRVTSQKYDTVDTDAAWDFQEETCLDIHADLHDGGSDSMTGTSIGADTFQAVNPKSTAVRNDVEAWLLTTTSLSLSPIVHVALIEPTMIVSSDKTAAETPLLLSEDGHDDHNAASDESMMSGICTDLGPIFNPGFTTPTSHDRVSDTRTGERVNADTMSRLLQSPEGNLEHITPLGHTRSTSNPSDAVFDDRDDASYWSTIASDTTDLETARTNIPLQATLEDWTERLDVDDMSKETKKLRFVPANPSFFTYLEEDDATEYVLNAGMAIMFVILAIAGHVLW